MKVRFNTVLVVALLGWLLGGIDAHAHNFWLESHPFRPDVDERVDVSVHVGIDMRGNALPNIPDWYTDFSYIDATGRHPVSGELGDDPAGNFWVRQPGIVVAGYRSTTKTVDMDATLFRKYLVEEGLEKIVRRREAAGSAGDDVREIYSRCAKTFIQVDGHVDSDVYSSRFGYTLELTPMANPSRLRKGDALEVELLFRGVPLSGARVAALRKEAPEQVYDTRTDAQGHASILLPHPGTWQIKAVEVVPYEGEEADWESFWASMTFELAE